MRVLAVDWSGDARAAHRGIRVAEADPDGLVAVRGGLDREGVVEHLLAISEPCVVGLDFSFGLPAWFARAHGCDDVAALWDLVAREGEGWLRACRPPFWGRGTRRPPEDPREPRWRRAEKHARAIGLPVKSTFQVGGNGTVGTGSLRGMPHLARLCHHGFAIWPFDDAGPRTVVEIYPSLWTTGARGVPARRHARIAQDRRIPGSLHGDVAESDHAFDAAFSALAMSAHRDELRGLRAARADAQEALEGAIWLPEAVEDARWHRGQTTVSSSASSSPS